MIPRIVWENHLAVARVGTKRFTIQFLPKRPSGRPSALPWVVLTEVLNARGKVRGTYGYHRFETEVEARAYCRNWSRRGAA